MNRILVIEDESQILDFVRQVLTYVGFEVKTAQDGEKGIELFSTSSKDLAMVITDIRMPGIDGNAVAKYIRSSAKAKTPIVAMSGYADEIKRELLDAALIKPFNLKALMDTINSVN